MVLDLALQEYFGTIIQLFPFDDLDGDAVSRSTRCREPYLTKRALAEHLLFQVVVAQILENDTIGRIVPVKGRERGQLVAGISQRVAIAASTRAAAASARCSYCI